MTVTAAQCLTWREILLVARHAPSPHNVQPWRVRLVSDDECDLLIDGGRTLPNEDHTGSFLLSAMGMFLEAIDLLAAPRGLKLEFDLCETAEWFAARVSRPGPSELIPFARMRLVKDSPGESLYPAQLFLERRTCRIPLRPVPVDGAAVAALAELAAAWGHQYTQVTDSAQIEEILAQNIEAVFHDMNVAAYHDEITGWFRFTDKAARRHLDGLDRRCMNLSTLDFWMSARLPWLLLFPPTRALLKRIYRRQLATVPTIGILSGSFFDARNAVHSGRFLMRFWLETANHGLYLHPYGNLVTNERAAEWFTKKTGTNGVWLVFKLGYSEAPPLSYRRSLEDILVS